MTAPQPYFVIDHGVVTMVLTPKPDVAPGNAQFFFDPDPACWI